MPPPSNNGGSGAALGEIGRKKWFFVEENRKPLISLIFTYFQGL
jgi:hypothetical protein